MRILIVEDDWTSREMLRVTLERMGHQVACAENGSEGWDVYADDPFPFVITDWMMPRLSGLDLCKRIRTERRNAYTYLILLTARTDRQSLLEAFEAGADDFLSKPFDPAELLARIRCGERVIQLEEDLANRIHDLAMANERMTRDLQAAAQIQESLLPAALPDVAGCRFAWKLAPCEELAGDILNVLALDNRYVALYLLDVSGHGVTAALMSVTLSRILSVVPGESLLMTPSESEEGAFDVVPPGEVLARLNSRFQITDSATCQYFTIVYGVLDLLEGRFRFAQAGHPPLLRHRAGNKPEFLEGAGFPIGFVPETIYEEMTVDLAPGDRLFLYSDGIVEANHPEKGTYGSNRLLQDTMRLGEQPLGEAVEEIARIPKEWESGSPHDDISILAVEYLA
ncbi:MAG: phosphoserine phosphatase RsbU/P [Candidatus Sumerlaeota bacterium]|nr:phosphoserine phosphatase RsbU/P [Candidatus Sumerlaeota bacterium]